MTGEALGLGVVGAGRFAAFATGAVADLPDVVVRRVADTRPAAAEALAARHGATAVGHWEELLADEAVDIVVIATPPAGHARMAAAALRAGKDVFCEKPLALDETEARELRDAVAQTGRVLVVDHVLRYNPLLRCLLRLRDELLGPVIRFCFENDAADEDLGPDHWFWDRSLSGGIFLEHGVHFFDAAEMLVGLPASAVQATAAHRCHGDGVTDLVSASVQHGPGVLAGHTHGFAHAHRCERQLMRIDFGAAEARVEGWIPVEAMLDLWIDDVGAAVVESLPDRALDLLAVPGFRLDERACIGAAVERDCAPGPARGRGQPMDLPHHAHVRLTLGGPDAKARSYAESVRAAMTDLVHAVRSGRRPFCGVAEGARAVAVAAAATRAADTGQSQPIDEIEER